eukprot:gene4068-5093_t
MKINSKLSVTVIFIIIATIVNYSSAYIHHLKIKDDFRPTFLIESFGFGIGGVMNIKISNWKIQGQNIADNKDELRDTAGFYIKVTENDSNNQITEDVSVNCTQILKNNEFKGYKSEPTVYQYKVESEGTQGFYNLYYLNCNPRSTTSFNLDLEMYNIDNNGNPNYLPIGNTPLPTVYAVFSAIEQHYIKTTGYANGWNVAYYIFACLQGLFFIVLIALIGTGWSFIKPFLSDKDKTIFMFVIPLQIFDNIALIMIDEKSPGSIGFASWKHLFTIVDIICCAAILLPIIWSMKHLRDASEVDDKAAQNLAKLKLFRQFYLFVICYIYFTRIVIFILKSTLPYNLVWLGDFFSLLASVIFYTATAHQFRPSLDNPYFNIPQDEDPENSIQMAERSED